MSLLGPNSSIPWTWTLNNILTVTMLCFGFLLILIMPFNKLTDKRGRLSDDLEHTLGLKRFPMVDSTVAWFVMESPTTWLAWIFYFCVGGDSSTGWRWPAHRFEPVPLVIFAIFQMHYLERVFIYPWLLIDTKADTSLYVVLLSFSFTAIISFICMTFIADVGNYPVEWLWDPRFLVGSIIYFIGYVANRRCDWILRGLRTSPSKKDEEVYLTPHGKVYRIPRGSWFDYVSAGNYLGELVEWFGFAVLTWSLQATAFFVCSFGYLIPRGIAYHRWYLERFPNYPKNRWAVIPGVV